MSFLYFSFAALYGEIFSVSFLFPAAVALYDRIITGFPVPSLYSIQLKSQQKFL